MVDNIDVASDRDLWALTELSEHLEKQAREVYLVGAGGEQATTRLMAASGGRSHLPTTAINRFDIREIGFLSDAELRPVLTHRFDAAARVGGYQPRAVDDLVRSANGNPSRLRDLGRNAIQLAQQSGGMITTDIAEAAVDRLDRQNAVLYQAQWNKCSDEARALLDKVAAQGPRGLSMPAEYRVAGPAHWVGVDTAREELVSRGLLRDDGQRVVVANAGFQDWVRRRIGRATEIAAPAEAAPELAQPAGPQLPSGLSAAAQNSEPSIFGTRQNPAHRVLRKDQYGRQLSLDKRPPDSRSILFTGQPGSGTSRELDQTEALAERYGWTSLRINASPSEPLENRFARAATADLGKFRKRHGRIAAHLLKRTLAQVTQRTRNAQQGAELRLGVRGFQVVAKRQWDEVPQDNLGKNLNDLADHLGKVALRDGKPVVLMVDNLDVAADRDLAALVRAVRSISRRSASRRPWSERRRADDHTRMLEASGGRSGAETSVIDRFDHREIAPMTDDELRPTLTEPLRGTDIDAQPEAVDTLVRSANGSPSRMRDLAEVAVQLGRPVDGITTDVAQAAIAQVNDLSRPLYQAQWNNCSAEEKDLFARVGGRGPQGMTIRREIHEAESGRWQELDRARQLLVARGMLREHGENGGQVTVADPGMHEWIQTRLGQSVAHLGVALPTAPTQAVTQSAAAAEPSRHTAAREYKDMKFTFHN